jgi:hypothetical protein
MTALIPESYWRRDSVHPTKVAILYLVEQRTSPYEALPVACTSFESPPPINEICYSAS